MIEPAYLERILRAAKQATPGVRAVEAGEPWPGERFYVTSEHDPGSGTFSNVLMTSEAHGDALLAALMTPEVVLELLRSYRSPDSAELDRITAILRDRGMLLQQLSDRTRSYTNADIDRSKATHEAVEALCREYADCKEGE
ncbi:MAG: hypothetical protein ABIT01_05880 [Thermoanaerobaculia bacterium]